MIKNYPRLAFGLLLAGLFVSGLISCSPPADPAPTESVMEMDGDMEHTDDHEHAHDEEVLRIANEGAVIRIVSPEEGAVFAAGEDIVVEVEIENFTLNDEGSHWHVYVDGVSYGMVVGETTTQVLRNLEPGDHEVTAYLANGDHEELEDGGVVHITVEE